MSCAKNGWTDRDAVWDAESDASGEDVLHGDVNRCPTGWGTFEGV